MKIYSALLQLHVVVVLSVKTCYVQVERHLRKLDQEVSKFKMELEADNAGITEVLEKRKCSFTGFHSINYKTDV